MGGSRRDMGLDTTWVMADEWVRGAKAESYNEVYFHGGFRVWILFTAQGRRFMVCGF